ncbi:hypothetical protein PPSIR1_21984 [Plesiocystis pacifica SIR-1]|uniref:Uncharacterized protein n=1 Tax=Plesiocystis pacifica SIR-1 TaxID=391625 RepID=A6FXP4_9BACT|nr:hypothetical protein [Plesiocystis pacifica]EDM81632.1 hypothetical protein PPSIR1_21984 [Plesiocystis pacifica SIR-1]
MPVLQALALLATLTPGEPAPEPPAVVLALSPVLVDAPVHVEPPAAPGWGRRLRRSNAAQALRSIVDTADSVLDTHAAQEPPATLPRRISV